MLDLRLRSRSALRLGLGLAAALLAALVVWQTDRLALRQFLASGKLRAETALNLAINALEADLARYEMVPQLLAELEPVKALAVAPQDAGLQRAMNLWLEEKNAALMASDIYVMRRDGLTIAASNHRLETSFLEENFSYRPYFIEALAGRPSRFYGVGTTSGVRGYFFSAPIRSAAGEVLGVIAVKIGVDRIEEAWRGHEYRMIVTDPEGVVFLSSLPDWLYGSYLPRTAERRAQSEASRRYADVAVWDMVVRHERAGGTELVAISRVDQQGAAPADYILAEKTMPNAGWTLHVLLDAAGPRAEAHFVALIAFLLLFVTGLGVASIRQRRAQVAERLALQIRAKAELEQRVALRTADLARVNAQLGQEIEERRATEAKLRATQDNLVQVGKLAGLGQMSAALSHEINQPLAAARNYADSAAILIDRGETGRARENISHILALIDRMAAIGRHLRNAARKPKEKLEPVSLPHLLEETKLILAGRLAKEGLRLEIDLPRDLPPLKAGATRLQQVLVNLLTNAADASDTATDRRILLLARVEGDQAVLSLRDHGSGVPPAIAERIFDPFFTTKGMGAGLGLGLSICYNIIRDFGGEIAVENRDTGAEFILHLPLWQAAEVAA